MVPADVAEAASLLLDFALRTFCLLTRGCNLLWLLAAADICGGGGDGGVLFDVLGSTSAAAGASGGVLGAGSLMEISRLPSFAGAVVAAAAAVGFLTRTSWFISLMSTVTMMGTISCLYQLIHLNAYADAHRSMMERN